eukprot:CAMPEP_0115492120 /NCGR_PEP_ID=MMETSP0271-20121206/63473_1 /TAXON_ID=71861 /ORGANISM="Scrippsiella trochoidea, Strain CCMP3099" /LENGTH=105 /DNA_ID=CAMNT_0002920523 /DNA_START=399 /DNA_END=716 /DNA_ORIENTATION=-
MPTLSYSTAVWDMPLRTATALCTAETTLASAAALREQHVAATLKLVAVQVALSVNRSGSPELEATREPKGTGTNTSAAHRAAQHEVCALGLKLLSQTGTLVLHDI